MDSLFTLDLNWMGHRRAIASALIRSKDSAVLIDPGPESCLTTLREQLALSGLGVQELDAILLTHIHLDHAGATGTLVRENPKLRVYVHERGAPHMKDPSKLMASAARLWGDDLKNLFGECVPVPAENVTELRGGETIRAGTRDLRVLYTPGHASHHVTFFDPSERIAFVGDTAGISLEGDSFVLPATPPPDVDLELWNQSMDAILELRPARLFLTHFGYASEPERHIASYRVRLKEWSDLTARLLAQGLSDEAAMHEFGREVAAEAAQHLPLESVEHYNFTGSFHLSWLGLVRYHRKRNTAISG